MSYASTSETKSRGNKVWTAQDIKAMYPAGTRICMDRMGEDTHRIPDGMCGTVMWVNDAGVIRCVFDNKRAASVFVEEDQFHAI